MAKAYKAVTRIEHGETSSDGQNETKVFEAGDVVKGLSTEVMRQLWDAGALEQVDVVEVDRSAETEEETPDGGGQQEPTG